MNRMITLGAFIGLASAIAIAEAGTAAGGIDAAEVSIESSTTASIGSNEPESFVPDTRTGLQVMDDRLTPISGVVIQIWNGLGSMVPIGTTTDSNGQTPWLLHPAWTPTEVIYSETVTPNGIALGKIESSFQGVPFDNDGFSDHYWLLSRTMPLAFPTLIKGEVGVSASAFPDDASGMNWQISLKPDSNLNFNAHIAPLMDGEAISEYLSYHGALVTNSMYTRGIAMVVPTVKLGVDGIVVSIRLHGDLSGETPTVDVYNHYDKTRMFPVGPALDVEPLGVYGDWYVARIKGTVAKGHLSVCVRSDTSGASQVTQVLDNRPSVVVPSSGAGMGSPITFWSDDDEEDGGVAVAASIPTPSLPGELSIRTGVKCDPCPTVQVPWACDPADWPGSCAATKVPLSLQCKIKVVKFPRECGDPGDSKGQRKQTSKAWKASFTLRVPIGQLATEGGYEYGRSSSEETSASWTAGPGTNGLGECSRAWSFSLDCVESWSTLVDWLSVGPEGDVYWDPCAKAVIKPMGCSDDAIDTSRCSKCASSPCPPLPGSCPDPTTGG